MGPLPNPFGTSTDQRGTRMQQMVARGQPCIGSHADDIRAVFLMLR